MISDWFKFSTLILIFFLLVTVFYPQTVFSSEKSVELPQSKLTQTVASSDKSSAEQKKSKTEKKKSVLEQLFDLAEKFLFRNLADVDESLYRDDV